MEGGENGILLQKHWQQCSQLEASEVLLAGLVKKGLLSVEEVGKVEKSSAGMDTMLKFLQSKPEEKTFMLFLEVLEENEEHSSLVKYLRGK